MTGLWGYQNGRSILLQFTRIQNRQSHFINRKFFNPSSSRRAHIADVVMPEHVNLLMSEPERSSRAVAIQMLKQLSARKLRAENPHPSHPQCKSIFYT